jgi:hypothetical protein
MMLSRRSEFAGEPADGVSPQRVDGKANFLGAVASAALESTLLGAVFAGRNTRQAHPVLAGGTHGPLNNGR